MAITERFVTEAAAGGGDGTEGDPWTILESMTNAVAGDRSNVKDDGTDYAPTDLAPSNAGTDTSPMIWRGYKTTIGDGYQGRNADGTLNTTNMPVINMVAGDDVHMAAKCILDSLVINHTTGTLNDDLVRPGLGGLVINCDITHSGVGGSVAACVEISGNGDACLNCDLLMAATTAGNGCVKISGAEGTLIGCRVKCTNGDGIECDREARIHSNLIYECGDDGILLTGINAKALVSSNTIVDNSGDGIHVDDVDLAVTLTIYGNQITDNGGYGFNDGFSTNPNARIFAFNRFRDNTLGAMNNTGDWPSIQGVTTDTGGPETDYTNAGADDYSLIASAPGEDAAAPLNWNMGFWQNGASGGGGGGLLVHPGMAGGMRG